MSFLRSQVFEVNQIADARVGEMYRLYAHYYGGTDEALFRHDLREKTHAILLTDDLDAIWGFSTMLVYGAESEGMPLNVIYSGDTIIDHRYWGKNDFAATWLNFAGGIKVSAPETPLYWLLIVKGHRTYRYLKVFSRRYYPAPDVRTPLGIKKIKDTLAGERFGRNYKPATGIVSCAMTQGYLRGPWATVPARARRRPEVAFFLEKNPHYQRGDELVCLCLLERDNLKPIAQRYFTPVESLEGARHA